MRWIKGDTESHIDTGIYSFDYTYLIYLINSEGNLIIENDIYQINKGDAFVFKEGLSHETINTGNNPRLLLGPMSENAFSVGISGIQIRQTNEGIIEWSDLYQDIWTNIEWPFIVDSSRGILFVTDIVLNDVSNYFICNGNNYIGSTSLKEDGTRPIITISGVINYLGLFQNGTAENNGNMDVHIYNLKINVVNSTLISNGGWLCQEYYCKQTFDNFIVNCSSNGPIIDGGGGIVGGMAANGNDVDTDSATLYIIGCSSSGNIQEYSGGIIGYHAGDNLGKVHIEQCWSDGIINEWGGGIVGYSSSNIFITKCYSTGQISGNNSGGIIGSNASTVTIEKCYSRGDIAGNNAGGIFGNDAELGILSNSYSSGAIDLSSNDFFGGGIIGGRTVINCYASNSNYFNNN
jgi:hypothetical protein